LRRADLHSDPIKQFSASFAADIRDANAMTLATATPAFHSDCSAKRLR
jgi:hypothetical protein